ncbi:uncharacterized protein LODBEIA_P37690 [Lodderomyces beijingensis]|uniref:Uncharacterized protein n=1 Tax=Lodderomyces beijingensis TaxID=1775926 RepID=A0ABP0ZQT6_9ASCO
MAVEQAIKHGDDALKDKDFLGAIHHYSQAIKENPQAFQAFLKRAVAYTKLKNPDSAKQDISTAFTIANERGKRGDIGQCYFRLGLIYFQEKKLKMALSQFNKAVEYGCNESTLSMWKSKCEYDLKNHPERDVGEDEDEPKEADDGNGVGVPDDAESSTEKVGGKAAPVERKQPKVESNIDEINKIAPMNVKIREDWYQSSDDVIITIYAKKINEDKLKVHFEKDSVSISFPIASGSEYNYNLDPLSGEIDVDASKFKVYSTKMEVVLKKKRAEKWPSLERSEEKAAETKDAPAQDSVAAYPSSSRKKVNWDKFNVDEGKDDDADSNQFFQKIFKDMDDDSRRAMMKSYVQSNGTVLTTNWDEAQNKEFETSPPEGMVAKKWGS